MAKPFVVLRQRYCPKVWRASRIGEYLTRLTEELGLIPLDDPIHGAQTRVPWYDLDLHAEVRKRTVRNPKGTQWHQDGDLDPGSRMENALVLWTNRTPTEFQYQGKIYQPEPFQVVIARNLTHRRPLDAPRRRWMFRQRVEVPQHLQLPE